MTKPKTARIILEDMIRKEFGISKDALLDKNDIIIIDQAH